MFKVWAVPLSFFKFGCVSEQAEQSNIGLPLFFSWCHRIRRKQLGFINMQKITLSRTAYFSKCTYCSIRFSEQTKADVILLTVQLSKHFVDTRNDDHRLLIDNDLRSENNE